MAQKKVSSIDAQTQEILLNAPSFLQGLLQTTLQQMLQSEFDVFINAQPYERTGSRQGYRNGSYSRIIKTRVGSLELQVCRDREGNFQPALFERYQRSEQSLTLALVEMYLQGVSTRKVTQIVEELCGFSISKSQVSVLAAKLDKALAVWRQRPISKRYRYLMIDGRYEHIRVAGQGVVSQAFLIVVGIAESGHREILDVEISDSENEMSWGELFANLKSRGLQHVQYVVSDEHGGLIKAIERYFQGSKWQWCQVHFMRNFLKKLGRKKNQDIVNMLKKVLTADDIDEARARKEALLVQLDKLNESIAEWVDENVEKCFSVFELPAKHRKKMKSTNMLERFNEELKRRSRVVRIFPNQEACMRLLGTMCMEQSEQWLTAKRYIIFDE